MPPPTRPSEATAPSEAAVDVLARASRPVEALAQLLCVELGAAGAAIWRWDPDQQQLVPVGAVSSPSGEVPLPPVAPLRQPLPAVRRSAGAVVVDAAIPQGADMWGVVSVLAGTCALEPVRVAEAVTALGGPLRAAHRVERLEEQALTDPLTGLANRRVFDEEAEAAFARHLVGGRPLTVVMWDVNGLKDINDTDGHDAGDRHLVDVAACIRAALDDLPTATVARLGGDEFAAVVPDLGLDAVRTTVSAIAEAARDIGRGAGIACGVATTEIPFDDEVTAVRQLLRLADAAQYRSKRGTLGGVVIAGEVGEGAETGAGRRRRLQQPPNVDALSVGLDAITATSGASVRERLRAAAEAITEALDAGGWWLSELTPDGRALVTVDYATVRRGSHSDASRQQAELGAVFPLEHYPASADALAGGCFSVELGAADNDPAEEGILVISGFTAMACAGGTGRAGSWLLEVCFDAISAYDAHVAHALRAVLAAAVAG